MRFHKPTLGRSCRKLRLWEVTQGAVGSHLVIVLSPLIDPFLSVLQGPKPVLIQAFIAELSVQAFYESVLRRLPWLDKRLPNSAFLGPIEHGLPRKLRPVVPAE